MRNANASCCACPTGDAPRAAARAAIRRGSSFLMAMCTMSALPLLLLLTANALLPAVVNAHGGRDTTMPHGPRHPAGRSALAFVPGGHQAPLMRSLWDGGTTSAAAAGQSSASLTASRATDTRSTRSVAAPRTSLKMGLLDGLLGGGGPSTSSSSSSGSSSTGADAGVVVVGEEVGSGSYGTVHLCTLAAAADGSDDDGSSVKIAKRAWTANELEGMTREAMLNKAESASSSSEEEGDDEQEGEDPLDPKVLKGRAERCVHYLEVEGHCLTKLRDASGEGADFPNLLGSYPDADGNDWLVFDMVGRYASVEESNGDGPAQTLAQVMEADWSDQHAQDPDADAASHHHLYLLARELNLGSGSSSSFGATLDATFRQLLRCVETTNAANIVHRDVKPQNLLVDGANQGFVLIDFGSAADLDPPTDRGGGGKLNMGAIGAALGGNGNRVGLEDGQIVALSPIYAAPEVFVRWDRAPLNFDAFSTALIFCQLLFNLLDERAEAAFRQQLEDVEFDLDGWLSREMRDELTPDGVEDGVLYLAERPGLWRLLRDMVHPNPERRASTAEASSRLDEILARVEEGTAPPIEEADGAFFAGVVSSAETCEVVAMPIARDAKEGGAVSKEEEGAAAAAAAEVEKTAEAALVIPRPLHFVATFERAESLGLILSEAEIDEDDDEEEELDQEARAAWERATADANPGEVFVRGIADGGQAERIGIFEIGDRLMGVGEFPFIDGGFGNVVELLNRQPPSAKTVTLHFDRKSVGRSHAYEKTAPHLAKVVGQGAWSSLGRRKAQEDRFILHEIHDDDGNAALLTGVFDGHGGNAASTTLSQLLPSLFSAELASSVSANSDEKTTSEHLTEALLSAYEIACNTYRNGCDEEGTCVADYDPREGIIVAGTGAKDLIAGSTVATAVMSVSEDGADNLTVLNCGDSRTLVVGRPRGAPPDGQLHHESVVHFCTRDHAPNDELEMERLLLGKSKGFSQPNCSMSRWRLKVGDYQYALSRSLEGSFATSKGIVSDPDVSTIDLSEMLSERELGAIIIASDGLWEVVDNEEAGKELIKMREEGKSADEAAKNLCLLAIQKGTSDNVSALVVYLD